MNHIIYQSAHVESRFANIAVNTNPAFPIAETTITAIQRYFCEKNMPFTWVVNQDDDINLIHQLTAHGGNLMSDIECLHCYTTASLIDINPTITISRIPTRNKEALPIFITQAFEGAQMASAQLFTDEVYFNPRNQSDVFFAYLNNFPNPVAYGATYYYSDPKIAMLSGAATLPAFRGQGLYRALLQHRIQQATLRGYFDFAIEAMAKTSAPICKKFGFRKIFEQKYFAMTPSSITNSV